MPSRFAALRPTVQQFREVGTVLGEKTSGYPAGGRSDSLGGDSPTIHITPAREGQVLFLPT